MGIKVEQQPLLASAAEELFERSVGKAAHGAAAADGRMHARENLLLMADVVRMSFVEIVEIGPQAQLEGWALLVRCGCMARAKDEAAEGGVVEHISAIEEREQLQMLRDAQRANCSPRADSRGPIEPVAKSPRISTG